jgi:hypothetical protein
MDKGEALMVDAGALVTILEATTVVVVVVGDDDVDDDDGDDSRDDDGGNTVRDRNSVTASPIFQISFPNIRPRICDTLVYSKMYLTTAANGPGMHISLKPKTPSYLPRLSTKTSGIRSEPAIS